MKIAVLCSDGPHHKYLVSEVCKSFDDVKIFMEPGKAQLRWKLLNKKYKQYLQLKYQIIRRKICGSDRFRKKFFDIYISGFRYDNYDILFTNNINESNVVDGIINYKPDIVIVMGTSILHKKILQAVGKTDIINIHGGYLPYYKGNHCFFFACYNKEYDKIGSTIHFINSGVDTGDIIEWVIPTIQAFDTPESLYCKAEKMAVDRLVALLKNYQAGKKIPRQKQEAAGRLYYTGDRKLHYDIALFIRKIKGEK